LLEIHIISTQPDLAEGISSQGLLQSAQKKGLVSIKVVSLRDFAVDHRGTIDDRPFGGGDGMVLRPEPLVDALATISDATVIMPSPRGRAWTTKDSLSFAEFKSPLVFICGRYAGIDQRFIDRYVDYEISVGDFVVSSGDLPALMWTDAIVRQLPGALGHSESAAIDSFSPALQGCLEYPLYTRPREFLGASVPQVLLSGDQSKIAAWRKQQVCKVTEKYRADLQADFTENGGGK